MNFTNDIRKNPPMKVIKTAIKQYKLQYLILRKKVIDLVKNI